MKRAGFAVTLVAALACAGAVQAETFPSRPLTMMVGFPPGGPTDTLARIVADGMKNALGQPIAVETVSGASGTIATGRVVHAAADGYTIGIGQWSSHVGSPAIYKIDYDIIKDLQPIALLAYSPLWILGKSALPPDNIADLMSWLKARKEPVTLGTVGTGSAAQLCAYYFAQKTGTHFQYVPYRGAAPALQDLIGGQIDMSCLEASATLPSVAAGKDQGLRSHERRPLAEIAEHADDDRVRRAGTEHRRSGMACGPQKARRKPSSTGWLRA